VELVTDFEVLLGPVMETFEVPLPLPRRLSHSVLEKHSLTLKTPLFSRTKAILAGKAGGRVELSDGSPVQLKWVDGERHYTWEKAAPGVRLVVRVVTGMKPLNVV
jgi:hypothetical protein